MGESVILKRADIRGLTTAILLPSVTVFGGSNGSQMDAVGPLTNVVGIGLFQRAVLTLQRAGIRQLIVVAGPEEDQLKQALGKGPRVTIPVRWMPIREFPLDDPRTWEALAAEAQGFALIASVKGVFSRGLVEQLRRDLCEGEAIVVAQRNQTGSEETTPSGLRLKVRSNRLTAFAPARFDESAPRAAEMVVLPTSLMTAAHLPLTGSGRLPIRHWLERAAVDGRVRVVAAEDKGGVWYQEVRSLPDVRIAERTLFNSLKGEFEGVVDRYFNRKLSRWFTRIFLVLGFSPNAITVVAMAIGIASAACFSMGTYRAGIVAALLFQLAAVIDCCDGEVARLTFTESPFGAWLDLAMDNVVHMAIFGGITAGLYATQAGQEHAWVTLAFGAAAVLGNGLSFLLVEKAQKIKSSSGWRTPSHATWSDFMLKNVASRDFSVSLLLFALLGKLEWFLWFAGAGSLVFACIMLWVIRPSAVARA
jgi:1L-myo-inositol 1-phosphate cytidylyltransferase / CDP-L-myo-inositol myo-inositolphosphotransferase